MTVFFRLYFYFFPFSIIHLFRFFILLSVLITVDFDPLCCGGPVLLFSGSFSVLIKCREAEKEGRPSGLGIAELLLLMVAMLSK